MFDNGKKLMQSIYAMPASTGEKSIASFQFFKIPSGATLKALVG